MARIGASGAAPGKPMDHMYVYVPMPSFTPYSLPPSAITVIATISTAIPTAA